MRKALKITLYIFGSLLLLLVGALVYLNSPWGQNFVRGKAEAFLRKKIKTELHVGFLGYGFPKYIVLKDVLFKDQARDTLIAFGELKVDLDMWALIHKNIAVQQVVLRGLHAHVYRNQPDTTFNFTYIIDAFTGPKDPNKVKDTTKSAPLKISLDRLRLDDIHARFNDYTGGTQLAVNLEHLDLGMRSLDLDKMQFRIKELSVSGLQTSFAQDTSYLPLKPKTDTKTKLQLVADNVHLERVTFDYNDALNKLLFGLKLGNLDLALNKFVLEENLVDIKKLSLSNTDIALLLGKRATPPAPIDTIIKKDTTEGWNVRAALLDLAGVNFKMDNDNEVRQTQGIDYAHLDVQQLNMQLAGAAYTSDSMWGELKHLTVKEHSGVEVKELRTAFKYNSQGATLQHLYLQTPHTLLQDHLEVHYPSLDSLKKRTQSLRLRVNIENSTVGMQDVLLFAPQLRQQEMFRKYANAEIKLKAIFAGPLDNLNITQLYASGIGNTEVLLSGRLSGVPEPKKISYNLNIAKLQSTANDINLFIPDSVRKSVRLPDKFGITGQVAGTIEDYNVNLYLASTDGMAYVKGSLAMSPGKGKERYDLGVRTGQLNIGHILRQDSLLGAVTATIAVKGQSFDTKTMVATADGNIASAVIKGYRYHDIKLTGKVDKQKGNIDLVSADKNVQLQVTGQADFSGKYMGAKADIKIDSIDLQALKLSATELRARGTIHADFPVLNPDYPKGTLVWWQPTITADGKRYYLDSLYIRSNPDSNGKGQNIFVDLNVLQARVTGNMPLTKTGAILQDRINKRYAFPSKDSLKKSFTATPDGDTHTLAVAKVKPKDTTQIPTNYDLQINAHIVDRPMLHSLLPGLTSFDSIHIDGALTPSYLSLNVLVPSLVYSGTTVVNGKVKVSGTDSEFTYKITADKIRQNNFAFWKADVHGGLDHNIITTSISLSDSAEQERFALAASMETVGDSQVIQLYQGLMLDYKKWTVAQPNRIVLAKGGFYVRNFEVSNGGQSIKANSDQAQINTPLKIDIANFAIRNITNIVSGNDTTLADGSVNGNVTIQQVSPALKMTGSLQVKNLSVKNDTLGTLDVQVNNNEDNSLDAKITLKDRGNDIAIAGKYFTKPVNGNDFDLNVDINALSVKSFETLALNEIRNSSGFVRGKLKVEGTATAPKITGELRTDNLATTVSRLNASFKMPAEKILFTGQGIGFNNFTIKDSAGNKAVINGTLNTEHITNPEMDLTIKANNWRALHSTVKDNKEFYGDLYLTANLFVKGTPSAPFVDGDLKILKGTNMTVVTPESNPEIESRKGIVVFVNMKDTARRNLLAPRKRDTVARRKVVSAGSDFNVNVSVDKSAQFSLVIDQASGDFLSVKGEAALNASLTPGGEISLSGSYAVQSGSYQLNYNFIKRKFAIQDGSIITFAGDPVKGTVMDITAVYETEAPPYDLVQRQIADQAQLNYYKQRTAFDVDLHMKGAVLQPKFTFDVQLPENKVSRLTTDQTDLIQSRLAQIRTDTSELNKQVFALLILNRFVSDDPFSSGASSSVGFTALQSVSTFIGEQLNRAAGKLVKGVDFSVDLATSEDYTTGDLRRRTDLNLAASKQLLNDRLKLTVGNNFELEGPQTTNNTQSSYVPTNLAADYLLSADGKYTMRAYRKAYDEGVLQGFVTETGLNFIVTFDYNRFKNVFKKKKAAVDTTK